MFPKIPPYEIQEKLGQGGTATVYLAKQPSLSRLVAVKVLPPYFAHDEELVERFKREATSIARLRHPNIVQVYDFGRAGDVFYLAMEFVAGGTLTEELETEGRLAVDRAIKIVRQVAAGLGHAHENRIIHRDIKPSNILLTAEGDAVITDFGIVKILEGSELTRSAAAGIGTAEYMSPEQSQGEPVDVHSDLYSLGVVFYELLTGRLPFPGENPMVIMHRHVYEEPASPALSNPAVRAEVADIVLRLLAKEPAERFSTCEQLVEALKKAENKTPERVTLLRRDTRFLRAIGRGPVPHAEAASGMAERRAPRDRAAVGRPSLPAGGRWARMPSPVQVSLALPALLMLGLAAYFVGVAVLFAPPTLISDAGAEREDSAAPARRTAPARERRGGNQVASKRDLGDAPTLERLVIDPGDVTVTVGGIVRFTAICFLSDDSTGSPAVEWSVSDAGLAGIDSSGAVTALVPGAVEVVALSTKGKATVRTKATVTILAPDPPAQPAPPVAEPEPVVRKRRSSAPSTAPAPQPQPVSPAPAEVPLVIN